jgi:hypothetical protein
VLILRAAENHETVITGAKKNTVNWTRVKYRRMEKSA